MLNQFKFFYLSSQVYKLSPPSYHCAVAAAVHLSHGEIDDDCS